MSGALRSSAKFWLTRPLSGPYNLRLSISDQIWRYFTVAYAIIRTGGKQFRVAPGEVVRVPSLADKNEGDQVEFDVLVAGGDDGVRIGTPTVDGARVTGTVVKHGRGPKIIVFKFKRRKQFKRKKGHRQGYTAVKIDSFA
jgi:large subunit ribosomal protein L21